VQGNEGIDVKEGSVDTLIANNEVYMQYDPESGGGCHSFEIILRGLLAAILVSSLVQTGNCLSKFPRPRFG